MEQHVQVARVLGVRIGREGPGVLGGRVLQPDLDGARDLGDHDAGLAPALLVDEGERAAVGRHVVAQLLEQEVRVVAAGDPRDREVRHPVGIRIEVRVGVVGGDPVCRELPVCERGALGVGERVRDVEVRDRVVVAQDEQVPVRAQAQEAMDLLRGRVGGAARDAAGVEVVEVAHPRRGREHLVRAGAEPRAQDQFPGHDQDPGRVLVRDRAARRAGRRGPGRAAPPLPTVNGTTSSGTRL